MRKSLIYITVFVFLLIAGSCKDILEIQPLDRVSADYLLATPAGVKTLLATLYNKMPMEDFVFHPSNGFNQHPGGGGNGDGGWSLASNTDEAIIYGPNGYTTSPATSLGDYWDYTSVRYVNLFLGNISALKAKGQIVDSVYNQYFGEAHFIRAYMYFEMARRYGGVPLISEAQTLPVSSVTEVMVPRATEKETWDYIMSELDIAIANLPSYRPPDGVFRATKWVAWALKSRASLHAASVAKFWNKASLTGPAVDAKLVGGMTIADANNYYALCIEASKKIMDNPSFALYQPLPATKEEAAKNYQDMFETPAFTNKEIIYYKPYIDGSAASGQGHVTDFWFYPKQLCYQSLYMSSRWGTTLDIVDVFEDYTDNGVGASVPVRTRTDGNESTYVDPKTLTTMTTPFVYYDNQYDIFKNKDARLTASVLLPGSLFKGTLINMQGGMIKSDSKPVVYTDNTVVGPDGVTYYTYGSPSLSGYSAFGALGTAQANYSSTGFALRKFLQETKGVSSLAMYGSTQGWIDMRLAEIYLNYAEAVVESGQGDAALAATCLNAIRRRANHRDNIPLTTDNVLKERRVELIFEDFRYWDLMRRRDFHTRFGTNTKRFSLIPMIDLRVNPPKYVFLRAYNYYDNAVNGLQFLPRRYYQSIPGVASNKLIQNPEY
jgi:starch-binding outer membrane protein, SusD/RagB family